MTDQFFAFYDVSSKRTAYGLGTAAEAARWRQILEQRKRTPVRVTPVPDTVAAEHHVEDTPGVFSLTDVLDEVDATSDRLE